MKCPPEFSRTGILRISFGTREGLDQSIEDEVEKQAVRIF